jgi:hypothetical protein
MLLSVVRLEPSLELTKNDFEQTAINLILDNNVDCVMQKFFWPRPEKFQ